MTRARDVANQINRVNSSAADATAITIDSSENVLVGKTSAGAASTGFESRSSGYTAITRDGGQPLEVRRLSSDGVLIDLRKDGSTVGSIGNSNGSSPGDLFICSATSGHAGLSFGGGPSVTPTNNAGALSDNTVDLGVSSHRFKDLILSGGVFLGGTGSQNKLSDYEEGTWTPTFSASSGSFTTVSTTYAVYTKVGRQVILETKFVLTNIGTASGNITVAGQPFATKSGQSNQPIGVRVASTGNLGKGQIGSQMSSILGYDGTSIINSGHTIVITAIYNTV